jgi:hypothetical protein
MKKIQSKGLKRQFPIKEIRGLRAVFDQFIDQKSILRHSALFLAFR